MKKYICAFLSLALLASIFAGCDSQQPGPSYIPTSKIEGSDLFVQKVEGLSDNFIMGMDASSVLSLEASGVKYYNFEGAEQDVFQTLAENGVNYIRVRVWNDPFDANGNGYGGGNCNIDTALAIGQRATKYGMKLLVNFHYSDFWADPAKQMVPKAWKDMDIDTKADALYNYTKESLQKLKDAGVCVGMVQVGNETNGAMCGEKNWTNLAKLFSAGSKAVREVLPDALVAIHFANPEKVTNYADYSWRLAVNQVDYDVFASSYYPYWHGTLENLTEVLTKVHDTYGKKVMIAEVSYAYTPNDSDFYGNTISEGGAVTKNYPYTIQGQANCIRDVIATAAKIPDCLGIFYWEGTWISVGGESWEENSALWEKHGSGWASSFASHYDPGDAGKYYGGCAVENQAFFDAEGKPLQSLRIFNLVRYGNEVALKADALEDTTLICDIGKPIQLPETVNAVMSDNSKSPVAVTWDVTEAELTAMAGSVSKHTIKGTADGKEATCYISVVEYNYLKNDSFEDGVLEPWVITDNGKADELYVEDKLTDSMTGNFHMHFWSAAANSVNFTLDQTLTDLTPGKYKFTISIMGGDAGEHEVFAYAKVNGEYYTTNTLEITTYGNWDTVTLRNIELTQGDELTVGIYVCCSGAGNGAWGKIDDAMLNSEN